MLGPRIVALQLLWQVVGGSVGGSGSGRFLRKNDVNGCELDHILSYPLITMVNCDENPRTDHESLSSRATFHC